jgi:arsenate reductase
MKLDVYGLTKCSTCQKALAGLAEMGHEATFHDVRDDGISRDVLEAAHAVLGDKLINRASYTWRGLSAEDQALPPVDAVLKHPSLMKRPMIATGNTYLAGWTKGTMAALTD